MTKVNNSKDSKSNNYNDNKTTTRKMKKIFLQEQAIEHKYKVLGKIPKESVLQPWWLNYDQALDLQSPASSQQNPIKPPPPPQHKVIKHEQVEQAR